MGPALTMPERNTNPCAAETKARLCLVRRSNGWAGRWSRVIPTSMSPRRASTRESRPDAAVPWFELWNKFHQLPEFQLFRKEAPSLLLQKLSDRAVRGEGPIPGPVRERGKMIAAIGMPGPESFGKLLISQIRREFSGYVAPGAQGHSE